MLDDGTPVNTFIRLEMLCWSFDYLWLSSAHEHRQYDGNFGLCHFVAPQDDGILVRWHNVELLDLSPGFHVRYYVSVLLWWASHEGWRTLRFQPLCVCISHQLRPIRVVVEVIYHLTDCFAGIYSLHGSLPSWRYSIWADCGGAAVR